MKKITSLKCVRCKKAPSELSEYIACGAKEGITPEEYVIWQEGTLNRKYGTFFCSECYIKAGMPLGIAPRK